MIKFSNGATERPEKATDATREYYYHSENGRSHSCASTSAGRGSRRPSPRPPSIGRSTHPSQPLSSHRPVDRSPPGYAHPHPSPVPGALFYFCSFPLPVPPSDTAARVHFRSAKRSRRDGIGETPPKMNRQLQQSLIIITK